MEKKCDALSALECELSTAKAQINKWESYFVNSEDVESVNSEKSEEHICNVSNETETIEIETIEIETIEYPLPNNGEISIVASLCNDGSTTEINIFQNYPVELILETISYLNDTDVLHLSHCNIFFKTTIVDYGLLKYHLNQQFSEYYTLNDRFLFDHILFNDWMK